MLLHTYVGATHARSNEGKGSGGSKVCAGGVYKYLTTEGG